MYVVSTSSSSTQKTVDGNEQSPEGDKEEDRTGALRRAPGGGPLRWRMGEKRRKADETNGDP